MTGIITRLCLLQRELAGLVNADMPNATRHARVTLVSIIALVALASCSARAPQAAKEPVPAAAEEPKPLPDLPRLAIGEKGIDVSQLLNVMLVRDRIITGSRPESAADLQALQGMGVRRVISVDGAKPNLEWASQVGIEYVHIPTGYNGLAETQQHAVARAMRDGMAGGKVYVHCHHGKHRSAAAVACGLIALGDMTNVQAEEYMHKAGTAVGYTGLWRSAAQAMPVKEGVLDALPANAGLPGGEQLLGMLMSDIENAYDSLKQSQRAAWGTPADHPDLIPLAEASRLKDMLEASGQHKSAHAKGVEYAKLLVANVSEADKLEQLLEAKAPTTDLDEQLKKFDQSCKACHVIFRDRDAY
jgi:protein tyrosine phosphatase (PTP) superfamily phosphohydrolase (DUF442 family)